MNRYNYEEVIHIIQNTRRFGNLTGFEVSTRMLEQLGNPQSGIPFVHVAGTNGKGSTTAFLCKILEQTGKKVGMFTSPHLIVFEERIRINDVYISRDDVTRLGNLLLSMHFDISPTMFDYCLAMAVLYFKEQDCDIVVMETGIGGRYDSTNALGTPEVAVITKIGFDHMGVLGNTLEEIAGEKAGIIKPGCSVVSCEQHPLVAKVLCREFQTVNGCDTRTEAVRIRQQCESCVDEQDISIGPAIYVTSEEDYRFVSSIPRKMVGDYQVENAAVASLAARVLLDKWMKKGQLFIEEATNPVDKINTDNARLEKYIRAGISKTLWKGRMEILNENPFFMIDGAHNSHGVWALRDSLIELYPNEKFHFIMGVMADKDYEEMIEALLPLAIDFVTVTPESSRALQSKDLAKCIQQKGVPARYAEDMEAVIRPLLPVGEVTTITKDDINRHIYLTGASHKTVAFGSLYFIGAIEAMLEKNRE